jgi:hypothetical protein
VRFTSLTNPLLLGAKFMAEKLDDKVHGILFRDKNNEVIPPDEFVVFRPQDNAFPATLQFYRCECIRLGCDAAQIKALDNLIERVQQWRMEHPERLKLADVEPGECRDIPEDLYGKAMPAAEVDLIHLLRSSAPTTLGEAETVCQNILRQIKDFRQGKGISLTEALGVVDQSVGETKKV